MGDRDAPAGRDFGEFRTLWMGDLQPGWNEQTVIDHVRAAAGESVNVYHPRDKFQGGPAPYCFIEFQSQGAAERFLETQNGQPIPGTKISWKLNIRHRRRPGDQRGGGGGRDGGRGGRGGYLRRDSRDFDRRDYRGGKRDYSASPGRWRAKSLSRSQSGSSRSRSRSHGRSYSRSMSRGRSRSRGGDRGGSRDRDRRSDRGSKRRRYDDYPPPPMDRRPPPRGPPGDMMAQSPSGHGPPPHSDGPYAGGPLPQRAQAPPASHPQAGYDPMDAAPPQQFAARPPAPVPAPKPKQPKEYLKVSLLPGRCAGEVPPGIPLGKLMLDYLGKWRAENTQNPDAVSPEDRPCLDATRKIIGARVNGLVGNMAASTSVSMHTIGPVFADEADGWEMLARSVLLVVALAVSMEVPTCRLVVFGNVRDGILVDLVPSSADPPMECNNDTVLRINKSIQQLVELKLAIEDKELSHKRALSILVLNPDGSQSRSFSYLLARGHHAPLVQTHCMQVQEDNREAPHTFHAINMGAVVGNTRELEPYMSAVSVALNPPPGGGSTSDVSGGSLVIHLPPRPSGMAALLPAERDRIRQEAAGGGGKWRSVEEDAAAGLPAGPSWASTREAGRWRDIHQLTCAAAVNALVVSPRESIRERVALVEGLHEAKIGDMARMVMAGRVRLVLVSGPHGCGLETVAKRLAVQMAARGMQPVLVSTTEFMSTSAGEAMNGGGSNHSESVLDFKSLNAAVLALTSTGGSETKVETPSGKRLQSTGVAVLYGSQALNKHLLDCLSSFQQDQLYRVYVEPLSQLNLDDLTQLSSADVCMLRTMVRDHRLQQSDASATIKRWKRLVAADEANVFPFQATADVVFNSSLVYDGHVLKSYVEPLLRSVSPGSEKEYAVAQPLLSLLNYLEPLPASVLPDSSLLNEFIGSKDGGVY